MLHYQILASTTQERIFKSRKETVTLKYQEQHGMKNFELSDGCYSLQDVQEYFEYIIKKHEILTDKSPVQLCVYKIKNKITFKIKTIFYS